MVTVPFFRAALGVLGLLLLADEIVASPGSRRSASPGYRSSDVCPERCSISGPNPANWSVYPDFRQIKRCKETMFYDFSLYDPVDENGLTHRIHACSSLGPDFSIIPASSPMSLAAAESVEVEYQVGWWDEGYGQASSGIKSLIKQLRKYIDHGHGAANDKPFTIYGQSGQATIGLYIGQNLLNQGLTETALKMFEDNVDNLNISARTLAMQLCEPEYDSTHTFGVMVTSDGMFTPIQTAIKSWANATCLSFAGSVRFPGTAQFSTPLLNSTVAAKSIHRRADGECRTVQVDAGSICSDVAAKCGISVSDLMEYNPGADFCTTLKAKQHVCCSSGDLPDFRPKPNPDGSCKSYLVQANDNCDSLAAEYSLTREELEDLNKNTWGWSNCEPLHQNSIICLSEGTPPFPAPIANAVCGPQKPGSEPPTDGSDIAEMNPCPLNACCNIWGQCGITQDFCIDTNTGSPGTAEPGSYGCISNCGMDVVQGDGTGAIQLGYYQGYCFNRDCLYQDAGQIDTSKYTHLHFGFGLMNDNYDVNVGDEMSEYQFEAFKRLPNVKRILSMGGWDFSTFPETYQIFRNGVKPENRLTMATKIADFIKEHDLDGVDIDWEYPGAPDLPVFDPGSEEDGPNYLAFLVVLKNLLRDRSVAIAAPASFWYLKQFPIDAISRVVDYIVFMTYDLHGQWDAHNPNSQEGCELGNCLRSHVNLTETRQSLAMITKAGVPGEKLVVGVASYGRSFKMASADCWGPECEFLGDRATSYAKRGRCTGTGGYIADAEINEILDDPTRVKRQFVDTTSNSNILVYDDDEWVSYMNPTIKAARTNLYRAWGLGGTTDWAVDLQEFRDPPPPTNDWVVYKRMRMLGLDARVDYSREGNWTEFDCMHDYSRWKLEYTPSERWLELGAAVAWNDIIRIWTETDRPNNQNFIQSVSQTIGAVSEPDCRTLPGNCPIIGCEKGFDGNSSGPAAEFIWNSMAKVHNLFATYRQEVYNAATGVSFQLDFMEDTFAPIPPEKDNMWTLLLIDLITLGTLGTLGPVFNTALRSQARFWERGMSLESTKDTAMTVVGQGTTIAKDVLPSEDPYWTPEDQNRFSAQMFEVIDGWIATVAEAVSKLFDGSDSSIEILWKTMKNGQLIEGRYERDTPDLEDPSYNVNHTLTGAIEKCIFGYSIPALWRESQAYTFIIDAGQKCDAGRTLGDYLDEDTMEATEVCVQPGNDQYFIVSPKDDAKVCDCELRPDGGPCQTICRDNKFSKPPGLDALNGTVFAGLTKEDLVTGSVRTWIQNGRENKGSDAFADPDNQLTQDDLIVADVTTPGFMRIPVCSAERAFQSWGTSSKGSSPNYPCDIPPGRDHCEISSFIDQTSDASPSVADCFTIIRNIEGDGGTEWTHQVIGHRHREIASHGSCAFGVEATKTDGNVNFKVGGQDVIDIINDAVDRFARDGKIGAKGNVNCNGNVKSQPIEWGIYHT